MHNVLVGHKVEEFDLQKFWKLESFGIKENEREIEFADYLETYQDTSIELREGRYIARLPLKSEYKELPSNYGATRRRTENVVKRLRKQPDLLKVYDKIIKDKIHRGSIEKVEDVEGNPDSDIVHNIPHHLVAKDSNTTPFRIVYECSCRQTPQDFSLNDCLMNTPPKLNDLSELLIRFRLNPIGLVTNIEKAFLHVGLHKDDRDATRFLWLNDLANPSSEFDTYRFKSVLFGATSSPFILNAVLLKHLHENDGKILRLIERDLYVDNILSIVQGASEAQTYFKESRELLARGGFNFRSLTSNDEKFRIIVCMENY